MGEALGPVEVGKELAEHNKHSKAHIDHDSSHDRIVSIIEALLLAVVAMLAAWSGYASAKWDTESNLGLAQSSTALTEAAEKEDEAASLEDFDAITFDAWFTAYVAGNDDAMALAERRFRPEFAAAFDAWMATDPATNPDAPADPTVMEEYVEPQMGEAETLTAEADRLYDEGAEAGENADLYVRITIVLATVLFLVGISGHFRVKVARIGLVVAGAGMLSWACYLLLTAPKPPG